jgi:hypothetical protein
MRRRLSTARSNPGGSGDDVGWPLPAAIGSLRAGQLPAQPSCTIVVV